METGTQLAAFGANNKALAFFNLEWVTRNEWRGSLANLQAMGLPTFTAPNNAELADGDHLVSSLCPRQESCPQRRLFLMFDRTYLQQSTQIVTTSRGHVLAGGPHHCPNFDASDSSQLVLKDPEGNVIEHTLGRDRDKAQEVEAVVITDPSRLHSGYWELAAYPVMHAASKQEVFESKASNARLQRGQWETLHRIGHVLAAARSVRYVTCDRHGSHGWLASLLLGREIPLKSSLLETVPFFSKLEYTNLPKLPFPCGFRVASFEGVSIHYFPGVAHAAKSFCEQLRSPLGSPHWGDLFSDFSGGLELGLPPASFIGTDAMSDAQAALMLLRCKYSTIVFFCLGWQCVFKKICDQDMIYFPAIFVVTICYNHIPSFSFF